MAKPQTGWITIAELASLLEITPTGARSQYLAHLDEADVDREKPMKLRFSAVLDLIVQRRAPAVTKAAAADGDPLLADGDSPALERYRLAKAKHAELDLAERKSELINRTACRDVLARWAVQIRRMGETLAKRYGNEASITVNDSLAECREIIRDTFDAD